jgi:hypothetical protein
VAVGPAITSITPPSGQQGQSLTVTLNGSNLTVAGAPVVTINQAQMLVAVTSATASQIRTTVGIPWSTPPASYTLTVTFPQIGSLTRSFSVQGRADQPPVISSVTPAKQFAITPTSGSPPVAAVTKGACTRITVNGQNLVGARAWGLQQADRTAPRLHETPKTQVPNSGAWLANCDFQPAARVIAISPSPRVPVRA